MTNQAHCNFTSNFFCYFIRSIIFQEYKVHVRCLNLLECHSKVLLQDHGVNIQKFKIVEDAQEVKSLKKNFSKFLIFYLWILKTLSFPPNCPFFVAYKVAALNFGSWTLSSYHFLTQCLHFEEIHLMSLTLTLK